MIMRFALTNIREWINLQKTFVPTVLITNTYHNVLRLTDRISLY